MIFRAAKRRLPPSHKPTRRRELMLSAPLGWFLKGKIAEQIAPLMPGFLAKYNPADARFIGSPIDYLIFRNMSKGDDSEDQI
jgi:predicted Holliday junction resolvase-like endonuclease